MSLDQDSSLFYLAEIIVAIQDLHNMNIIYRDLKPENILIGKDGHIKFIDFGFAKKLSNIRKDRAFTNCGTPGYSAPEVMLGQGYTYKADIWSIGILLCEMIGGFTPFVDKEGENNPKSILERIRTCQMNLPKNLNNLARDLVKNILVVDANLRFEIEDIKQHKFFRTIDWKIVQQRKQNPQYIPPIIDTPRLKEELMNNESSLSSNKSSPNRKQPNTKILGDYQLQKINKVFLDF